MEVARICRFHLLSLFLSFSVEARGVEGTSEGVELQFQFTVGEVATGEAHCWREETSVMCVCVLVVDHALMAVGVVKQVAAVTARNQGRGGYTCAEPIFCVDRAYALPIPPAWVSQCLILV